jgi:hypothetical protein
MGEKSFEYDLQKLGRKGTIADTYSRYSNISCASRSESSNFNDCV